VLAGSRSMGSLKYPRWRPSSRSLRSRSAVGKRARMIRWVMVFSSLLCSPLRTPVNGELPRAPLPLLVKKEEMGVTILGCSTVVNEVRSLASPSWVVPGCWTIVPWLE